MTRSEFKVWFEGFCENLHGVPNKRQWARIQERVAEIDETPITPIVIERWHRDYWYPYLTHTAGVSVCGSTGISGTVSNCASYTTDMVEFTPSGGGGQVMLAQMGALESQSLA